MPERSSASRRCLVKLINEDIKGLEQVTAYLDNVIIFDSDPTAHVKTMRTLFVRLRKHDLNVSTSKARLWATDTEFMGHSISSAGVRQNGAKFCALRKMRTPRDLKYVRTLLG